MIPFMLHLDGYKTSHRQQYPSGTEFVYSNFTARKGREAWGQGVVNFGLQYFLEKYFNDLAWDTFFSLSADEVCAEYSEFMDDYLPGNSIGTDHIRALHELQYLPLRVRALPEGAYVPYGVPLLTIENTHPDFFWLTNYFETLLSSVLWKPITSATLAREYRKILNEGAARAGVPTDFVPFQAHDFSFRGMSGPEDAALSGAGHLTSFTGTDTIPAILLLKKYYDAEGLIGGSVPATEHAVMMVGGDEYETFHRLITDVHPTGLVSIVSDTWDLWAILTKILPALHDEVVGRDGTLVVRPDSGDPVKILVGDPEAEGPARKGVVELLWDEFGGTTNDLGYRVLDSHVGAIYGDSITLDRARRIRDGLIHKGFCPSVVLGVGSYSYQYTTRDTHGMAMKATWALVDGEERLLFKDPITDDGTKKSAKGRLVVQEFAGDYILHDNLTLEMEAEMEPINALRVVWENGEFVTRTDLAEVRQRVLTHS